MKPDVLVAALALAAQTAPLQSQGTSQRSSPDLAGRSVGRPTIVLVHGAFADGSGWAGVYKILRKDGYAVRVVQNPTITLDDDVAATRRLIDADPGAVLLVGHSYGGAVITVAGNDPKVVGLVYIAAFAPDSGESVFSLNSKDPISPVLPPQDGFLLLDKTKFAAAFAADVNPETATFMAESQVPWGLAAAGGVITQPAWRTKPSWYLLTKDDHMIPPSAQRMMSERTGGTVEETPGSHAVYMSRPGVVAALIEKAATKLARK